MSNRELVSVVMPSFNQAKFITQSIESIFNQPYDFVELIVSDGGSTDSTPEILEQLASHYPRLRWWSEPDNGPAHALNKAIAASQGTLIGWLNSDDLYSDKAISQAVETFSKQADTIMLYGHGQHIDAEGRPLGRYPTRPPDVGLNAFAKGCFICQPTVFFRRTLTTLLGPLSEDLKTTFDYEYWLRAFSRLPDRIGFIPELMASSRLHDECITMRQRRNVALEGVMLCSKYLERSEPHWLTTYFEEVHKLPPDVRGFDDFDAHCIDTIQCAEDYLSAEDRTRLLECFT